MQRGKEKTCDTWLTLVLLVLVLEKLEFGLDVLAKKDHCNRTGI